MWYRGVLLAKAYPDSFALAQNKDGSVWDHVS